MNISIARVNLVHLINADSVSRSLRPSDHVNRLELEVHLRLLSSTSTIAIYYCYSARKLILILPSRGGWVNL